MKAGMITFHRAYNVGAALQASALQRFITENIMPCEIIDYVPNNQFSNRPRWLRFVIRIAKPMFFLLESKENRKRKNRFHAFQKEYMKVSDRVYYGDSAICKDPPQYDILISGSDQIFNVTLSGNSESYYLHFVKDVPKISYASSFGRTEVSDEEIALIKRELPSFERLSFREQSAAEIVRETLGVDAPVVLDPTFLLDSNQWENMCEQVDLPEKYIFVYAMEYTTQMVNMIHRLEKHFCLPVFVMPGSKTAENLPGHMCLDFGPAEFLYAIRNATIVATNSFHGTAMSMVFHKWFFCIAHSTRNTRLENIMALTQNSDKLIYTCDVETDISNKLIDGAEAYRRLKKRITASKEYIFEAIKAVQ